MSKEMDLLGIDGIFAPVLDVNQEENNPIIGIRSFSDDPQVVSSLGKKFFLGISKNNLLACGKHFPGHGCAKQDSHKKLPVINFGKKQLYEHLQPFKELIQTGVISKLRVSQWS